MWLWHMGTVVALAGLQEWLGLMLSEAFSNLKHSVIPRSASCSGKAFGPAGPWLCLPEHSLETFLGAEGMTRTGAE